MSVKRKLFSYSVNLLLLVSSILLVLVLAEIAMHIFYPWPYMSEYKFYIRYDKDASYDIAENSPVRLIQLKGFKYKAWSNELGCFDCPYKGEKDYVLLLGDSFTWGFTDFKYKYGTLMEKYLGMRVLKCGVGGYGTAQELIKARKIIEKIGRPPKLIVVGYFINNDNIDDLWYRDIRFIDGITAYSTKIDQDTGKKTALSEKDIRKEIATVFLQTPEGADLRDRVKFWLRRSSILYNVLAEKDIVRLLGQKIGFCHQRYAPYAETFLTIHKRPWIKDSWEENINSLKGFKALAQTYNTRLLFVLIPMKENVYTFLRSNYAEDYDWDYPNQKVISIMKDEGLDFLDMTPVLREFADLRPRHILNRNRDFYWDYEGHWNRRGNELAGLAISRYILEQNLLEVKDGQGKIEKIKKDLRGFKR